MTDIEREFINKVLNKACNYLFDKEYGTSYFKDFPSDFHDELLDAMKVLYGEPTMIERNFK